MNIFSKNPGEFDRSSDKTSSGSDQKVPKTPLARGVFFFQAFSFKPLNLRKKWVLAPVRLLCYEVLSEL